MITKRNLKKILRIVLNFISDHFTTVLKVFYDLGFLKAGEVKITRDSLEISADKTEVGWLMNLCTFCAFPCAYTEDLVIL